MPTESGVRVVGLGAGGHAGVVADIIARKAHWTLVGFLDSDRSLWDTERHGVPVLGGDELLGELAGKGVRRFFIGVGSVGDTTLRRQLYREARGAGLEPVVAVHSSATVADSAQIGPGAAVMAGAVINPGCELGENVVVNTGAVVEHDCRIGDHAFVSPGACLAGGVVVGAGAHVGLGATVREGREIGEGALVGAGAVVVDDVSPRVVVVGVPARVIRAMELE